VFKRCSHNVFVKHSQQREHKGELAKTTIGEGTMWRAYPNPNLRVMAQGRLLDTVGPKIREAQGSKPSPAQSTKSFSYKKAKGLACEWWKVPSIDLKT